VVWIRALNSFKKRTHTCGELRVGDIGKQVSLCGWVDRRRDLGGVIFIDLRDRYGKTQVVFQPQRNEPVYQQAKDLRSEYVLNVVGLVERRPAGTDNPALATGEIDVLANELRILSKAETPPFPIEDTVDVAEDLRLKYRYLDIRRTPMKENLIARHRAYQAVRKYFDEQGFIEVETPMLMKSTPEGARDYLVPSRIHRGKFYALPQSPQTYKQILMVAGLDKYFQIVKCFRDEDFRADRQAEFTQIDVEMSFVDEDDVIKVTEGVMARLFKELKGIDLNLPFPRMTYKEAMEKYGIDKPDLRFGLQLVNVNDAVAGSSFRIFSETVRNGGIVSGFVVPGGGDMTRNQLDNLVDLSKSFGAQGLIYLRATSDGVESPIEKYVSKEMLSEITAKMGGKAGDLCLLVADKWLTACSVLGNLRLEIADRLNLISDKDQQHRLLWVTDFPLFEYSEEEKRYVSVHHPFTSPKIEDLDLLEKKPEAVRARSYDLVLNGTEIAGGSVRIHDPEVQTRVFSHLGMSQEEAKKRFGFLLEAFRYGAPPHGGIAFGFDRIMMLLLEQKSLRDVIAFPKTSSAMSLMDDAPSEVDAKQLKELHIKIA
jgi:aspartyl-tRNA synthetase